MRGFMIFEARKAKSGSEIPQPEYFMLFVTFSKLNCPSAAIEKEKLGETQALDNKFWGSESREFPTALHPINRKHRLLWSSLDQRFLTGIILFPRGHGNVWR